MKKILFSLIALCLTNFGFAQTYTQTVRIQPNNYGPKLILNDPTIGNKVPIEFRANDIIKWEFGQRPSAENHELALWRYNGSHIRVMTWDQLNGNVGIGLKDPLEILHVKSDAYNVNLRLETDGSGKDVGILFDTNSGQDWKMYLDESDSRKFKFQESGSDYMTLDVDGKVGIGTTSPTTKLDVRGELKVLNSGSSRSVAYLYAQGTGEAGIYFDASNGDGIGSDYGSLIQKDYLGIELNNYGANPIHLRTADADRLTVAGDGKIGIGTTSPSAKLHIDDQSGQKHRGLVLSGNWASSGTHYNLMSFKATDALNSDAFLDTSSEGTKNFHLGLVSDVGYFNQDRFSIIQGGVERFVIGGYNNPGTVGIGTTSPTHTLTVQGGPSGAQGINIKNANSRIYFDGKRAMEGHVSNNRLDIAEGYAKTQIFGNVGIGTSGPSRELEIHGSGNVYTKITSTSGNNAALELQETGGINWSLINEAATNEFKIRLDGATKLTVSNNGNVGIGSTNPTEKLAVDGTVLAKKVRVSTAGVDWPDFVFAPSYELRALSEVEEFVKENKHLPEVPSAKEVEKEGLDLGKMDATLLKKVEELTLYLIEINKKVERLEKENQELKSAFTKAPADKKKIK